MISIKLHQLVNENSEAVLALLLAHDQLGRFFDGRFCQTVPARAGESIGGAGAIRQVTLHGQTFLEQIISADAQHICYQIIGKGPVSEHQGVIMFNRCDEGTLIDYTISCRAPWWQPSWLVNMIITRDISRGLAKLARYCDER